jgi:hypothetical protein
MAVFKPRSRMISFRLSEDEYERLKQNSLAGGARSVSDYARLVLSDLVAGRLEVGSRPEVRIEEIDRRIDELRHELKRLSEVVEQHGGNGRS